MVMETCVYSMIKANGTAVHSKTNETSTTDQLHINKEYL